MYREEVLTTWHNCDIRYTTTVPTLVIFSIPKAFHGQVGIIQQNALRSWKATDAEVVIFGDEPGCAQVCQDLHIRHCPTVACSPNGTGVPLVSDAFQQVQEMIIADFYVYVNADIILLHEELEEILQTIRATVPRSLTIARRWNIDVAGNIDLSTHDQRWVLRASVHASGTMEGRLCGIDIFIFPRGILAWIPTFVVGRAGWDGRLVYEALEHGLPVIDATGQLTVIHQNHDYSHVIGGRREIFMNCDAIFNGQKETRKLRFVEDATFTIESLSWMHGAGQTMPAPCPRQPRLSIVTPISQAHPAELEATILSVLQQRYMNLEYLLVGEVDAGISPLIKRYERYLAGLVHASEGDTVRRAFDRVLGAIVGWLPPGCTLTPGSINAILAQCTAGEPVIVGSTRGVPHRCAVFGNKDQWMQCVFDPLALRCMARSPVSGLKHQDVHCCRETT